MKHNFDHVDINEMEEMHGPLFKFSEYAVGQHITYSDQGAMYTGEILWIAAPQDIVGKHLPYHLLVNRDRADGLTSFPDIVYRTDVISDNVQQSGSTHSEPHYSICENNGDGTYDCKDCGMTHPMHITVCPAVQRMRNEGKHE